MMNKMLVFDMDGTIADLYGVENWLPMLRAEDPTPYIVAKPMYDMDILNLILGVLKTQGWKIVVTSWLSKESTMAYDEKVSKAKREWLERYNFPCDEMNFVAYGTIKHEVTRSQGGFQILVDDNEEVRKSWKMGTTINAKKNIIDELITLLTLEDKLF